MFDDIRRAYSVGLVFQNKYIREYIPFEIERVRLLFIRVFAKSSMARVLEYTVPPQDTRGRSTW